MYKDIIQYRLADDATQEHLLGIASKIIDTRMSKLPWFVSREIHKDTEGDWYTDIVTWESASDAQAAETAMAEIPDAPEWYACYQMDSIRTTNIDQLASMK